MYQQEISSAVCDLYPSNYWKVQNTELKHSPYFCHPLLYAFIPKKSLGSSLQNCVKRGDSVTCHKLENSHRESSCGCQSTANG